MSEKYYVVGESELRAFLYEHAQGMQLEDEDTSGLTARPVEEFGTLGDSNTMWEEII